MNMNMTRPLSQSGNALWFILIAIVILGGLTILMSRSSSTSEDAGDYERTQINVSELVRFSKSVEVAVNTLISRGCSEKDINFDTPALTGYDNTNAPDDESCNVFSDKGAGLAYKEIQPLYLDTARKSETQYGHWVFNGALSVANIGTDGFANSNRELVMIAPFLTQELCMQINQTLGIENLPDVPPKEDNTPMADFLIPYVGTFGGGADIDGNGNTTGGFAYKSAGCTTASNNSSYYFYQVLLAR